MAYGRNPLQMASVEHLCVNYRSFHKVLERPRALSLASHETSGPKPNVRYIRRTMAP